MRRKQDDGTVIIEGELGPGRWQSRPGKGSERAKARRGDGSPWTRPSVYARAARRRGKRRVVPAPGRPVGAVILEQRRFDAVAQPISNEASAHAILGREAA